MEPIFYSLQVGKKSRINTPTGMHHVTFQDRAVPKVMPPAYFHGNYNRYKERNNTI